MVNVTALITLDKTDLEPAVGQLPASLMREVDRGLRRVLGLLASARRHPGAQRRPAGAARRCGRPRLAALYGVIAMETGAAPTLIALPAVLVAVPTGVTVPEPLLTT